MAIIASILNGMAKKTTNKGGRPPGRAPTVPIYIRLEPTLAEVFDKFVGDFRPRTSTTAVVSMLIEKCLAEAGVWPPPEKK